MGGAGRGVWSCRRYSHSVQVFRSILEGCFASSVILHEQRPGFYLPIMLHPRLCTNCKVSSVFVVLNASSMLIEYNACM